MPWEKQDFSAPSSIQSIYPKCDSTNNKICSLVCNERNTNVIFKICNKDENLTYKTDLIKSEHLSKKYLNEFLNKFK